MEKPTQATIVFYDEGTRQLRACTVFRREIQGVIDRELARGSGMTIPPGAAEPGQTPVTDEDARKLGAFAILMQAGAHPELRARLQITTAAPMDWTLVRRPDSE